MRCDLSDSLRITRKGAGTDCCTVSTAKKSKCPEETAGIGFETTVCSAPETACVLQLHPASLPANAEKENINREKNRMTDVFIPWKMTLRIYDKLNSITNNRRRYFSSPPFDSGRRWQEISSFGLFARIGEKNRPDNRIFLYKKRPQRSRPNNFLVSKILLSSSPEILILILIEEIYPH